MREGENECVWRSTECVFFPFLNHWEIIIVAQREKSTQNKTRKAAVKQNDVEKRAARLWRTGTFSQHTNNLCFIQWLPFDAIFTQCFFSYPVTVQHNYPTGCDLIIWLLELCTVQKDKNLLEVSEHFNAQCTCGIIKNRLSQIKSHCPIQEAASVCILWKNSV